MSKIFHRGLISNERASFVAELIKSNKLAINEKCSDGD